MHEFAIARNIVDAAQKEVERHSAQIVTKIKLRLGRFSGIDRDALTFAIEAAKTDAAVEVAELDIEIVPLEVKCKSCGVTAQLIEEPIFLCADCGEAVDVVSGSDLQIEYIQVE